MLLVSLLAANNQLTIQPGQFNALNKLAYL